MQFGHLSGLLGLAVAVSQVRADDVVYITDLEIFTLLVPCAQSALNYDVMGMTEERCPEAVTAMQSCVCSKNNYYSSLASQISSDVSESCGKTATDDQASVSAVFSHYCNQDATVTFPTPSIAVTQYITDIPEISYLAPCAVDEISYIAMSMTYQYCQADTPDLATCMCQKQQNSLMISQSINTYVRDACSSHTVDISSAQAFFSAYCNLVSGTSSFPTPTSPAGDMSYYISDMPAYSELAPCASSALSYAVFTNTNDLCPEGPQLLASCACIKESMSGLISNYITSNVKWECSSSDAVDTADITSALAIFDTYCSAALDKLVVSGITESISQTEPAGKSATTLPTAIGGAGATRKTSTHGSSSTHSSSNGGGGSDSSHSSSGSSSGSSSKSNTPVIVGAVVGVVAGLAILAVATLLVFRCVRRNKSRSSAPSAFQQLPPDSAFPPGAGDMGKPELAGTELTAFGAAAVAGGGLKPPVSPSPSVHNYGNSQSPIIPSASPVSSHHGVQQQQLYLQAQELYSPGSPGGYSPIGGNHAELPGQQAFGGVPPVQPSQPELYGGQPVYQADSRPVPSPTRPAAPGLTWQSGPVTQSYAELDSGHYNGQTHAQ